MPTVVRPWFQPDPTADRAAMKRLQRDIATVASFEASSATPPPDTNGPVVGVDQAVVETETATQVHSATVAMRRRSATWTVVEMAQATVDVSMPYVSGLLAFREAPAALHALEALETDPAVILVDGSGRLHYRQAGLATHLGVVLECPTVGITKSLLCGRPTASTDGLDTGDHVPIVADNSVTAQAGTRLGAAVQTRQYDSPDRHINPVYVSPGHRVTVDRATALVQATTSDYKLPEPIRQADTAAGNHQA